MFGTTAGKVIVMSSSGTMIAQVVIHADLEITHLGWSAERFRLVEQTNNNKSTQTDNNRPATNNNNNSIESDEHMNSTKPHILSVVLSVGDILLMTGYDDLCPRVIHTGLRGVRVEWSNDGNFLAVVGHKNSVDVGDVVNNELRFYNKLFKLQLSLKIPANQSKQAVSAITWGHKDQRLFVAVGCEIFTIWVFMEVSSLQLLCKTTIHRYLHDDFHLHKLPLPGKLLNTVAEVFSPTIKGYIPHPKRLREYVCTSPPWKDRLHCTIMRHGDESSGGCYVLYLEHLGGLIPLLKGKRASKLHPDFVIYDPQVETTNSKREDDMSCSVHSTTNTAPLESTIEDSDSDINVREGSPITKKIKFLKLRESLKCRESNNSTNEASSCEPIFEDSLPEARHLVSITSNIWGTKFRFIGVPPFLPEELGTVTYKTSLLHLQPRQMTVGIVELPKDSSFQGNLSEPDVLDNDCNSNSCSYLDADDELYANYFYDIENLDHNSNNNCMVAMTTDNNSSDNNLAAVASNLIEASSSSSFSPISSSEDAPNLKDSNSSKSNLSPPPILDLSITKSSSPIQLSQNFHLADLQVQLNEKIARVSPTEVDPFLEFFMKDRSSHVISGQLESSGFMFINSVRDVMVHGGLRQELEEVKQMMLENGSCSREGMNNKIISSISDVTLVSSQTITQEVNVILQDEFSNNRKTEEQEQMPGVSLQYIDDDNDLMIDLYERQVKKDVNSELDNLSARDVMIRSGSPMKIVGNQNRETKERLPVDNKTYSPSKNLIMKPLMCGKAAVSSSECSDFDSIQSMCSFEPCKTRLLITAGGGINSLTPEQTPSKLGRLSIGSVSKSRLREIARNALCRGNSNANASCVGSGVGNSFCGQHNARPKRRFFNGLCGISDPRGSTGNQQSMEDVPRSSDSSSPGSPVKIQQKAPQHRHGSLDVRAYKSLAGVTSLSSSFHSTNLTSMPSRASNTGRHHLSASLPSSPIHKQLTSQQSSITRPKQNHFLAAQTSTSQSNRLAGRSQLQSPLLLSRRRVNKCNQAVESSDEDNVQSSEDVTTSENYQNLETFQKARLHKKLKKVRSRNGENETSDNISHGGSPSGSPQHVPQQTAPSSSPRKFSPASAPSSTSKNINNIKHKPLRNFVMHNKAPMWNDTSQVYQLDFGGRVTQESAKNFQIEFGGKQVMQFGRIDNNAYTLDFQYPYSATQAFAVALANVTQRLK